MIWGYHHFRKPPIFCLNLDLQTIRDQFTQFSQLMILRSTNPSSFSPPPKKKTTFPICLLFGTPFLSASTKKSKDLSSLLTQKGWDGETCPRSVQVNEDGKVASGAGGWRRSRSWGLIHRIILVPGNRW